jgi:hypothetical protein
MRRFLAGTLLVVTVVATGHAGRIGSDTLWDDGRAEVARYTARGPRYGRERAYEVVTIVVKEPFDIERGVKAQVGGVEVLKFNQLVTMPTGIYTYRQMSSFFLRRADLAPLKLAVSSQEWCGTTFKEWRDRGPASALETHSYFEGEGDRTFPLAPAPDLVFEDAIAVVLRDDPASRRLRLVASEISNRAAAPEVSEAAVERSPRTVAIETAIGRRRAEEVRVVRGGRVDRLLFDTVPPHVLLLWERADGHVWRVAAVKRLDYWNLNRPGDEGALIGSEAKPTSP